MALEEDDDVFTMLPLHGLFELRRVPISFADSAVLPPDFDEGGRDDFLCFFSELLRGAASSVLDDESAGLLL